MRKGSSQLCTLKKRQNDPSSDGRNFFWKRPICNLKSSAETCVYALPYIRKSVKNSNSNIHFWCARQTSPKVRRRLSSGQNSCLRFQHDVALNGCNSTWERPIFNLLAAMLPSAYFVKNIKDSAKSPTSSQFFRRKCEKALPSYARVKSVKKTNLPTAITFYRSSQFQIWKVLQKRGCMLHNICENQIKTTLLTVISAMRGKPVHKGGWARGAT